jgi:hypothetical protein
MVLSRFESPMIPTSVGALEVRVSHDPNLSNSSSIRSYQLMQEKGSLSCGEIQGGVPAHHGPPVGQSPLQDNLTDHEQRLT